MADISLIIGDAVKDILDDGKFPDVADVNYWQARKNRVFYIDGEIDDYNGDGPDGKLCSIIEIGKVIINMNMEEMNIPKDELKPIILMVNSYGGDLALANNFCDIIKASRIPIITVAMGATMSAAFLIFISGHKRFVFKHSSLLVHQGSGVIGGSAAEIEEAQKHYQKQIEEMKTYILENTRIDEKVFNRNKKKDWYLNAQQCLEMGICDVIIEHLEDIKMD